MADTTELAGEWTLSTSGLLRRHVSRWIRVTVEHPGINNGQTYEGTLTDVGPSDVSSVYQAISFRGRDGSDVELHLPLSHPIEVLVLPMLEPAPTSDVDAGALLAEAIRRYDTDPLFYLRAQLAARLAERTDFSDLDGAVLTGAVLALVVAEHPELIPGG